MKSYEFTGKNIEKAIENGLKELNKTRDEVTISVLSEGGLFSKAKISITIDAEVKEEIKNVEEKIEEKCECCCDEKNECDCECDCDEECNCGCHAGEKCDCNCHTSEECHCEECREDCECEKEEKMEREYLSSEQVFERVQDIFQNIFKMLNIDAKVMILENEEAFEVKVMGDEKVSCLIGFRGEGLNAYQFLINNFQTLKDKPKKIYLDVENYRSKREESLRALAVRMAKKVLKFKRKHKFEPMTAYERHVIHEELSTFEGIQTYSEGYEPHRCLVVDIKKDN